MIHKTLPLQQILTILTEGEIQVEGRFLWGSNYTFLATVTSGGETIPAVYKPSEGERPLWDFPHGSLAEREVAAYLISSALGWNFVPPTVLREDGPAGLGSLQFYVDADLERHYFTFSEEEKQLLRPVALYDVLINNADRKGGHVLLDSQNHLWLIDHGVSFHEDYKLRTVIWDFAGQPIPESLLNDLRTFEDQLRNDDDLRNTLVSLLSEAEFNALLQRTLRTLGEGCFPEPRSQWSYPWPLV
ncbi:MAG: SCO1664 family protein [Anaerolineales bacterium]|nr:SCO1664 family protein [Anaerolineales bacterium]